MKTPEIIKELSQISSIPPKPLMAIGAAYVLAVGALAYMAINVAIAGVQKYQIDNLKEKLVLKDSLEPWQIGKHTWSLKNTDENDSVIKGLQRVSDSVDIKKIHPNWPAARISAAVTNLRM